MFGPITVVVEGKKSSGKSLMSCVVEKCLRDVGFNNIQVVLPSILIARKRYERMNKIKDILHHMDKNIEIIIKEKRTK